MRRLPPPTAFAVTDGGRSALWAETGLDESHDCSVRAWAIAKQIPYTQAHAEFKAAGRKDRHATPFIASVNVMGEGTWVGATNPTFAQWLRDHTQGRYVVHVRGHAFAVVDGVHYDNGLSLYKPRARVWRYWKIGA